MSRALCRTGLTGLAVTLNVAEVKVIVGEKLLNSQSAVVPLALYWMMFGRATLSPVVFAFLKISLIEIRMKFKILLVDVPCKVSQWSDWTSCNAKCGGGLQSRWRKITQNPVGDSLSCPPLDESRPCNQQPCGRSAI